MTPEVGQVWRSRDPRDDNLSVRVLAVDETHVTIQRFRKTRVRLDRFHRDYYPDPFVTTRWRPERDA